MNICAPFEAKAWFKKKVQITWSVSIASFIVLAAILTRFNEWWTAVIFSGIGAVGVFALLDRRSIGLECTNCKRIIDTNTPWLCGFGKDGKLCRNENTNAYPFIHECEHCHYIPKAYKCHHCGELIFLSKDRQQFQFARCLVNSNSDQQKRTEAAGDKLTAQKTELHDLEHRLRKTELEKKIAIERNRPEGSHRENPEDALTGEIEAAVNGGMKLSLIEQRLKEKADVEFANDEHKRQQKHALIEREIMKRLE